MYAYISAIIIGFNDKLAIRDWEEYHLYRLELV